MGKAFLVIDMLNDFVHPQGMLFVGEQVKEVVASIKGLLGERRRENTLVVYVCDAHRADDVEFTLFPSHCVVGSWGAEVFQDLTPQEGDNSALSVAPLLTLCCERGEFLTWRLQGCVRISVFSTPVPGPECSTIGLRFFVMP
jgi:nicotinamidase-related amidase